MDFKLGDKIQITSDVKTMFYQTGDVGYLTNHSLFHQGDNLVDEDGCYWFIKEDDVNLRICIDYGVQFRLVPSTTTKGNKLQYEIIAAY